MSVEVPIVRLGQFERALAKLMPGTVHEGMHAGGSRILRFLREQTALRRIMDQGTFANGWSMEFHGKHELEIANWAPHALFVERGRAPGKPPPVAPLMEWAGRKLGRPELGYAIAKSIGKKGIKPRPVMEDETVQAQMQEMMSNAIREKCADFVDRCLRL